MFTKGYCFDDVLLVPKHSEIESRDSVDLSVELPRGIKLGIPLVSANMKTVTGVKFAREFSRLGGLAILHRFDDYKQLVSNFREAVYGLRPESALGDIGASIGIHKQDLNLAQELYNDCGCRIFCIDVAHGDHGLVSKFVEVIRKECPDALLIAGNVATESGARLLWESGADVVKCGIGGGCLGAGTRILMSDATYKNIEDIVPGDRIINKDGFPKTVLKAFCTGSKNVIKIRNSINYKDTYVTPDHKYFIGDLSSVSSKTIQDHGYSNILSVNSRTKTSKFKWQGIGDSKKITLLIPKEIKFEIKDTFSFDIYIRDGGNGISVKKSKIDFTLIPTYELGYVFGTFLGDGHALLANNGKTDTGAIHWYFGLNEDHIANKLNDCINKITNRSLKIQHTKNIINCILYHKPFAEFLGMFGKKTHKHLPKEFIVNNKDYLKGIHDGLVDSDGSVEANGRVNFSNTSTRLIELFNIITYILTGVFPNNQKKQISIGNLSGANIENFSQSYVCRINKSANKRIVDNFQVSKLLEASEVEGLIDVFDLTIDCDTHSFIADNAIVHNSLCTTRIETGNGYPQLSAINNVCNGDYKERDSAWPMFISDGGIKSVGDCVKALAFADLVMIGNLFAGTDEAPGEIISVGGQKYKQYAGSSTHKQKHIEGVIGLVPYKGPIAGVVQKIVEGIKSGCSYQGAENLKKLKENPEFVIVSNSGLVESHPHDVKL